jgi:hypothetical protein
MSVNEKELQETSTCSTTASSCSTESKEKQKEAAVKQAEVGEKTKPAEKKEGGCCGG